MGVDVVEVIVMDLFFGDDVFEKLYADAVSVVATGQEELVVDIHRVILQIGIEHEDGFHRLASHHLSVVGGDRLSAHFLHALGEHFRMPHFIDGDEFDLGGQFAVVHVVQVVVLVHVLVDGQQFHGAGVVQHFDDFFIPFFSIGVFHSLPPVFVL